jgi:tRNA-specific adenosine deaminase 2
MEALDALVDSLAGGSSSGGDGEVAAPEACAPPAADTSPLARLRALLSGATLYVTVEPCIMCAAALRTSGVGRIVYGAANDKFGGAGTVLDVLAGAARVERGLRADEAVALLRRFYARANTRAVQCNGDQDR